LKMVPFKSLSTVSFLRIFRSNYGPICTISEIKRDIGRKSRFFIPLAFDASDTGSYRRNFAVTFGAEVSSK